MSLNYLGPQLSYGHPPWLFPTLSFISSDCSVLFQFIVFQPVPLRQAGHGLSGVLRWSCHEPNVCGHLLYFGREDHHLWDFFPRGWANLHEEALADRQREGLSLDYSSVTAIIGSSIIDNIWNHYKKIAVARRVFILLVGCTGVTDGRKPLRHSKSAAQKSRVCKKTTQIGDMNQTWYMVKKIPR